MPINKRFPDYTLISADLSKIAAPKGAGVIGPNAPGVTLKEISENVSINLMDGLVTASHSRPSMFAHIFSFAENVKKSLRCVSEAASKTGYAEFPNLEDYVRQDFVEWQGMVAAVALSNVYSGNGLNLSVKTVALDASDVLHQCILREMEKGGCYKSAVVHDAFNVPVSGQLFYICQNGVPFALFHPEIGLCAMKEYDASIFEGVLPWHKPGMGDCHKAWEPIALPGEKALLNDFCLSRVIWWAENLSSVKLTHPDALGKLSLSDLKDYVSFLKTRMHNPAHPLNAKLQAPKSIPMAEGIDNIPVWKGLGEAFGTAMMFYLDENGVASRLPMLFLDTMLLTSVANQGDNMLIYNKLIEDAPTVADTEVAKLSFADKTGVLENYAPVAPFRGDLVKLLACCGMEDLAFEVIPVDNQLKGVKVTVALRNSDGESFSMEKVYASSQLRRGMVPYMMVWPYLPMPKMPDGQLPWKSFYASWQDQADGMVDITDCNGCEIDTVQDLTFDFEKQATARQILRATAPANSAWTVCNGEKPFRYALLKGKKSAKAPEEAMGIVFVPGLPEFTGAPTQIGNGNPVRLSVDFGTTSTVCALRHVTITSDDIINLPFRDYSRTVTCYNEKAKRKLDQEWWLGNTSGGETWEWNEKIFSVAQRFQRADVSDPTAPNVFAVSESAKQIYYVDGRLLLVSGSVLTNYASKIKSGDDPLRRQQIMNDMKFATKLDVLNYQAASIYLSGIYMYAVLYLLSQNVVPVPGANNCIKLCISYPNEVTLQALKDSWGFAAIIVAKAMHSAFANQLLAPMQYYSEATATSAYTDSKNIVHSTLVSVDIGGGTSDISISKKTGKKLAVSNLSVRYAGREMMVSSLIQTFRRLRKGSNITPDSFAKLWMTGDETLTNQFEELCEYDRKNPTLDFLRSLITDSTVRMNVEMLLSEGMNMNVPGKDFSTRLLRQLIALKFFMLMKIVAKKVHDSIYLWVNSSTGDLNLIGNNLDIHLYINGTSAQMLQYIFDCDMAGLEALKGGGGDAKMKSCMVLINSMFAEELSDVLTGDQSPRVRIITNSEASKKVEVAHGMLCDQIDDRATKAMLKVEEATMKKLTGIALGEEDETEMSEMERSAREDATQDLIYNYPLTSLKEYLEGTEARKGLLYYVEKYEKIYFPPAFQGADYGLGSEIPNISKLLEHCGETDAFADSRNKVAETRAKYMVEREQENYQDLLTCMYLVEEIIDWEMADRQL